MAALFAFFAVFALLKIVDSWLRSHPAVPDSPAALIDS